MGGQDHFRGELTLEEHMSDAKKRVSAGNRTTAILYVNEMVHLPQEKLLSAVLQHMLSAVLGWKSLGYPPSGEFHRIKEALAGDGWSGRLAYTHDAGRWEEYAFGSSMAHAAVP